MKGKFLSPKHQEGEENATYEENIGNNRLMKERSFFKIFRGRFQKKGCILMGSKAGTNERKSEQRKQETKRALLLGNKVNITEK
jgi:hypothetical protein